MYCVKADFHSVQNVARSTFKFSERFLLNYKQSSGTNLISCGWLHTFQKKALAKNRSRDILHWMEIRALSAYSKQNKWISRIDRINDYVYLSFQLLYRVVFSTFQVPANFSIFYLNNIIPQVDDVRIGDILADQSTLRIRFWNIYVIFCHDWIDSLLMHSKLPK